MSLENVTRCLSCNVHSVPDHVCAPRYCVVVCFTQRDTVGADTVGFQINKFLQRFSIPVYGPNMPVYFAYTNISFSPFMDIPNIDPFTDVAGGLVPSISALAKPESVLRVDLTVESHFFALSNGFLHNGTNFVDHLRQEKCRRVLLCGCDGGLLDASIMELRRWGFDCWTIDGLIFDPKGLSTTIPSIRVDALIDYTIDARSLLFSEQFIGRLLMNLRYIDRATNIGEYVVMGNGKVFKQGTKDGKSHLLPIIEKLNDPPQLPGHIVAARIDGVPCILTNSTPAVNSIRFLLTDLSIHQRIVLAIKIRMETNTFFQSFNAI